MPVSSKIVMYVPLDENVPKRLIREVVGDAFKYGHLNSIGESGDHQLLHFVVESRDASDPNELRQELERVIAETDKFDLRIIASEQKFNQT